MNTTDPVDLEALLDMRFAADNGGATEGQCYSWWKGITAELTARRARDAEVAVLIASELARIDGYDPEDQHGGLYDLRWSGGPNPEPEGDAWHMDYLPKGERIAAILAGAKP